MQKKKSIFIVLLVIWMLAASRNTRAQVKSSSSSSTAERSDTVYVYVIDMSTSMEWIFDDVKEIVKDALRKTKSSDSVTLIVFGDTVTTLASYDTMNEGKKETVCKYLDSIYAESVYTNIGLALTKGVEHLHQRFLNKPAKDYVFILVTDGKDHPPPTYVRDHSIEEILTKFPDFLPGRGWSFRYIVLEGQFDPELLSCVQKFGESFFDVERIAKSTRLTEAQIIQGILEEPQAWVAFPIAIVDHAGQVEIRKADEDKWVPIPEAERQRLIIGDQVRTGAESAANITFGATGQLGVQEKTVIRLEETRVDPVTKERQIEVNMERGAIWNALNASKENPVRYNVVTPIAITGVRGTNFRIVVDQQANKMNVSVLDGTVEISSVGTATFRRVPLPAGSSTDIVPGEKPSSQPLSEKILHEWEKWKKALIYNKPLNEINVIPVHVIPSTVEIVLGPIKPATREAKKLPLKFSTQYFGTDTLVVEPLIDLPPGAEIRTWVEDTENPLEKNVIIEITCLLYLKHAGKSEYSGKVRISCVDPMMVFKDNYLDVMVIHDPPTFADTVRGYPPVAKGLLALLIFLPFGMIGLAVWKRRVEVLQRIQLFLELTREKIRLIKLMHVFRSRPCGQLVLQNDVDGHEEKMYDLAAIARSCKKTILNIGSDLSNAISLSQGAEAFHCLIWASRKRNPTKIFISPCSKKNVAVNAEKVEEVRQLNDKDIVEIGPYVFKFVDTQFRSQIKVFMMNGKMYKGMLEYWDLSQSIFYMIRTHREKEKFSTIRFDEVAYVNFYRDQSERERRLLSLFRRRKTAQRTRVRVLLKNGKKISGFLHTRDDADGATEGTGIFLIPEKEKSNIQYTYIPLSGIKKIIND